MAIFHWCSEKVSRSSLSQETMYVDFLNDFFCERVLYIREMPFTEEDGPVKYCHNGRGRCNFGGGCLFRKLEIQLYEYNALFGRENSRLRELKDLMEFPW